jgi:hypothetical protein
MAIRHARKRNETFKLGLAKCNFSDSNFGPEIPPDASGSLCKSFWWGKRVLSSILDPVRVRVGFGRFRKITRKAVEDKKSEIPTSI